MVKTYVNFMWTSQKDGYNEVYAIESLFLGKKSLTLDMLEW